jgi:hypothetical protein
MAKQCDSRMSIQFYEANRNLSLRVKYWIET